MDTPHHHVETILIGEDCCMGSSYYGNISQCDFSGFNFSSDFMYMCQSTWTKPGGQGYQNHWCDTGYQNVNAAAHDIGVGWIYEYGLMESSSRHSFTLLSLLAAAAWSSNQDWDISSYADTNGALTLKASDQVTLGFSKAQKINLNRIGHKGDFSNIAAIAFEMVNSGSPGNTCTYGQAVQGAQLVVDKIRLYSSKKADLKNDNGQLLSPYMLQHQHNAAAHVAAQLPHALHGEAGTANANHSPAHQVDSLYHTQLLSLGHDSGLTSQFALPQAEHFGM